MAITVQILGSSSATPVFNRHHSAQYLCVEKEHFLIDCGEGTQMQLKHYGAKYQKINHIFISHLHGDHYLGLVGFISTLHLNGRKEKLHIYGPYGLMEIITVQFKYSETLLNYPLQFHEIDPNQPAIIFENNDLTVSTVPLKHRIACTGFVFREKPKKLRINKELLPEGLLLQEIADLKKGLDIFDATGNVLYKNETFTLPPKPNGSYAYMSDTIFDESIVPFLQNIDLLYHEATFATDLADRAKMTFHSTAFQAATIASLANVKKLLIGHFSSRYKNLDILLEEAVAKFPNTALALEGLTFSLETDSLNFKF